MSLHRNLRVDGTWLMEEMVERSICGGAGFLGSVRWKGENYAQLCATPEAMYDNPAIWGRGRPETEWW